MTSASDRDEPATSNASQGQAQDTNGSAGPAGAAPGTVAHTSERKRQSNVENSKRSTGPKTPRGKKAVRYNALKHGFYASAVVIPEGDGREWEDEFDSLLEGLERSWEPTNTMQYCLVRTIAETEWRLRRAQRAEVGEIRQHNDSYRARLVLNPTDIDESALLRGALPRNPPKPLWSRPESREAARKISLDLRPKLAVLEQVREQVRQRGSVPEDLQQTLDRELGKDDPITISCRQLSSLVQSRQPEAPDAGEKSGLKTAPTLDDRATQDDVDDQMMHLLVALEVRILDLSKLVEGFEQAEEREFRATILAHNLPSKEFVDKLTRYESMLEKKKIKAIDMLLKLKGEV